ncbi:hypothetical protein [Nocardia huaxiensis]|uniref:Uncharacterized protein n=1 Tax=Nocardia huaxiensis TaxID=2755382 RepID=A0A7D6ZPX6_9NOCA|nr:hypothetical protein [Nocardia huaxiensis]QLY30825.1 hypothetical protein H0264_38075 [Nocardia huaxiensis]UFS94327.1 hypothetical protein LPY97_26660 [Nocardia huaxiensis]
MPHLFISGQYFLASGMTKNGTRKMTAAMTEVPDWTADTAGYPGSVLVGNALKVQGAKAGASLVANVTFAGGSSNPSQQAQLMVNGVQVATSGPVSGTSGVLIISGTADLKDGDLITVQAQCTASFSGWESTIQAGTGTFVRIS